MPAQSASQPSLEPLAVSVSQASQITGLSRSVLYPRVMSGELRSFLVGTRRLIAVEDLRRWLDEQRAAAVG